MTPDEVEAALSRATEPYRVVFKDGEEWLLSAFSVSGQDHDRTRKITALVLRPIVAATERKRELFAPGTAMEFDAGDVIDLEPAEERT